MGLDQLASVVDMHQLAAQPDFHLLTRRADVRRHRVQGLQALDVMVGMDFGIAPVGDFVGLTVPGQQGIPLLILENHQGLPASGAMDAHSGYLPTPALGFGPQVGQAVEIAALEETLPDVLHATLHLGLVLGFPHPRRIGDETAALRVFQEASGEARMQRVWSRHRWRAIVDDQILGHPAEADPRRFQSGDDVLQRLPMGRPDEAVPRVSPAR